ncbi:MAG: VanZ family protein [Gammaproteobacteria bacterium]
MPKPDTLRLLSLILTLAWMGTIFLLSSQPGGQIEMGPPGFDKILHMGAYALLALLILGALPRPPGGYRLGQALAAAALAAAYGLTDEWHQFHVPGRSMDGWDLVADAAGALLGALVLRRLSRRS